MDSLIDAASEEECFASFASGDEIDFGRSEHREDGDELDHSYYSKTCDLSPATPGTQSRTPDHTYSSPKTAREAECVSDDLDELEHTLLVSLLEGANTGAAEPQHRCDDVVVSTDGDDFGASFPSRTFDHSYTSRDSVCEGTRTNQRQASPIRTNQRPEIHQSQYLIDADSPLTKEPGEEDRDLINVEDQEETIDEKGKTAEDKNDSEIVDHVNKFSMPTESRNRSHVDTVNPAFPDDDFFTPAPPSDHFSLLRRSGRQKKNELKKTKAKLKRFPDHSYSSKPSRGIGNFSKKLLPLPEPKRPDHCYSAQSPTKATETPNSLSTVPTPKTVPRKHMKRKKRKKLLKTPKKVSAMEKPSRAKIDCVSKDSSPPDIKSPKTVFGVPSLREPGFEVPPLDGLDDLKPTLIISSISQSLVYNNMEPIPSSSIQVQEQQQQRPDHSYSSLPETAMKRNKITDFINHSPVVPSNSQLKLSTETTLKENDLNSDHNYFSNSSQRSGETITSVFQGASSTTSDPNACDNACNNANIEMKPELEADGHLAASQLRCPLRLGEFKTEIGETESGSETMEAFDASCIRCQALQTEKEAVAAENRKLVLQNEFLAHIMREEKKEFRKKIEVEKLKSEAQLNIQRTKMSALKREVKILRSNEYRNERCKLTVSGYSRSKIQDKNGFVLQRFRQVTTNEEIKID